MSKIFTASMMRRFRERDLDAHMVHLKAIKPHNRTHRKFGGGPPPPTMSMAQRKARITLAKVWDK